MKKYVFKRLLQLIFVLWGITFVTFVMTHISSVDAVDIYEQNTGIVLSTQQKNAMKAQLGLDDPLPDQYVNWILDLLQGNLGNSYVSGQSVVSQFFEKLPATLILTVLAVLMTLLISIPLGIFAATRQNQWIDVFIRLVTFMGNSMPHFFVALLSIYFFCLKLNLLPVISQNLILPVLTLTVPMSSKYIRQIRTMVLEEMHKEYIIAAQMRGVKTNYILIHYILRSVLPLIMTLVALSIGSLLGGSVIVESVFMWDGIGKMALDAIMMKDIPVIQAYVIYTATVYVLINLMADLLNFYLQPTTRWKEQQR